MLSAHVQDSKTGGCGSQGQPLRVICWRGVVKEAGPEDRDSRAQRGPLLSQQPHGVVLSRKAQHRRRRLPSP